MAKTKIATTSKKGTQKRPTKSDAKRKATVKAAALRVWSARDIEAARNLKEVYAAPVSAKLQGKKSKTIRRAVFSYYRG
jgi:hypothetical protein